MAVAVTLWMGALPSPTRAADDPAIKRDDPVAQEARRHYEEGTKAFNLGEYPRAVSEFKAAYNAKPDPLLLYNIAQAHRLGGDAGQALFFYRSFLRNLPTASNRKEVEGRIRALEKQVDEQKREATPVPAPVVPRPVATTPSTPPAPPTPTPTSSPAPLEPRAATGDATTRKPGEKPPEPSPSTSPPPLPAAPLVVTEPAPPPGVDLSTPPNGEPPRSSPFYKKWWFWTGVGVLLVIGVAAAARDKPPSTTYGLQNPTFVAPTSN